MASTPLLSTYLNDHLAGSEAARDLAAKSANQNKGTALGSFLEGLLVAIEEDRSTLLDLMQRVSVEKVVLKQVTGKVVESMSRIRLHQAVTGDPDLSRLMELESLSMGVTGKLNLWLALREVAITDPRLADVDFDALIQRARSQLDGIEQHHRDAARQAFTD